MTYVTLGLRPGRTMIVSAMTEIMMQQNNEW
jgi:hypothetical protein